MTVRPQFKMDALRMVTLKYSLLAVAFASVLVGLPLPVCAQPSPGSPLSGLELLKDFESERASSSDPDWRNGNADSHPIAPWGTLVLVSNRAA